MHPGACRTCHPVGYSSVSRTTNSGKWSALPRLPPRPPASTPEPGRVCYTTIRLRAALRHPQANTAQAAITPRADNLDWPATRMAAAGSSADTHTLTATGQATLRGRAR
jgi:hypothetical protein